MTRHKKDDTLMYAAWDGNAGERSMTQLIGAICDEGTKVLTVSDRMVSTGDMSLAFEHPRRKAESISDKAMVLTAGTVHEPDLLSDARERAKGKERIRDIAEVLKEVYQELRACHIEDEVLRPLAGLQSFKEYHEKQKSLHDNVVFEVNAAIREYRVGLVLLLAGVDESGHLIRIGDPGKCMSFDSLAYCCVGMGDRHADNVFAWYTYSQDIALNNAMYIAFEAKKRAEMAGGVGQTTDIVVIDKDGAKEVCEDTIAILEEVYNERETRGASDYFIDKIRDLKIRTREIRAP